MHTRWSGSRYKFGDFIPLYKAAALALMIASVGKAAIMDIISAGELQLLSGNK